ncbi:MAG TPA: hydantoinase/oxoprolinase family protein [Candidatus Baltobacteraceae bacterium]|nr:hydantoinase/oxoprolinase family protein [Candidatus Baltobacteraceae bacterium]
MAALEAPLLRVGIDVGGTFTDLVAMDARTGERIVIKCASTPRAPEQGVLAAIDRLPPCTIEYLAHSTTIATNALLGQMHLELPRIAFITTAGFRDVIEIGRQNRSEVYNLFVTRPKPLVAREDRLGVNERIDFKGNVLVALEQKEIDRIVAQLRERNVAAVAIGLLHSYVNDTHELRLQQAIEAAFPGLPVTRSSAIDPEYREYERFSTAVVNAALLPIIQRYVDRLSAALRERGIEAPLYVMQSNGGMASADRAAMRPASIVESGPASGVIGAADLARRVGVARVLSFDMGGTTAKTGTIVDGVVQVATEFEAAGTTHSGRSVKGSGYPVRFPFVDLAEISAGGGTIAHVDDAGALRVGPLSAGADPGPACYGRSDRATVTDANVVLGRLNREALVGGTFPIHAQRSYEAIRKLAERIGLSTEETAAGIVRIVDAQMAKVLRIVTVERGLDPRDFTMVAFGGNGPLHGCALAEELGMRRVIIPEHPGVFSAHGLLVADLRASFVRPVLREASEAVDDSLRETFEALEREARELLRQQGARDESITFRREYDMRYRGQSFELDVEHEPSALVAAERFHDKHERRYGYAVPGEPVEIVNARLTATAAATLKKASTALGRASTPQRGAPAHIAERNLWIEGEYVETHVYARETLPLHAMIGGPALIEQYDTCTYVAPGWSAKNDGTMLLVEKR